MDRIFGVWQLIDQEKIHSQCLNNDPKERIDALRLFREFFSSLLDKQQAWNDLHILINDESTSVRYSAASALDFAFSHLPDKQQAWSDLHILTKDKDMVVRYSAFKALGSVFSHVPDKQQAWNDLHRLTNDEDSEVRSGAAEALGSCIFSSAR